jgi:hypothetical protein
MNINNKKNGTEMKIGDKVRFVSETGGGTVAGFKGNNIVLVEDEDGFQIPMLITDVVVVGNDDYSTARIVENKKSAGMTQSSAVKQKTTVVDDDDPSTRPVTFKAPAEERKGGDKLSAYLAFVPIDMRELTSTRFETYIVNDSNYYMQYAYSSAEGANWRVRSVGEVEPNTKLYIEEFGRDILNEMEHVCLQIIAYKRDKSFLLKPAVNVQLRLDAVKFYKLHTFQENDFFEQPALVYTVIENDKEARPLVIDAQKLKQDMMNKVKADIQPPSSTQQQKQDKHQKDAPLIVDLHAGELFDTTAGLEPSDILNYQLETFRNTLKLYGKKKGQKIVFIHGKGEGVLRRALINDLQYRFKHYHYQDASFQEYGYGATQVTIR